MLGVTGVPMGRDLRAGRHDVLDEIVAPARVFLVDQDNQARAEKPVRTRHRSPFVVDEGRAAPWHSVPRPAYAGGFRGRLPILQRGSAAFGCTHNGNTLSTR